MRLLTTGCNTAIENLSIFIEKVCGPLVFGLPNVIKDTSNLLDIIDNLNSIGLPENVTLVSYDIVNMVPNIDNERGMEAVRCLLDSRVSKAPPSA